MPKKDVTARERLAVIETLLGNHLKHHDMYFRWVIIPIAVCSFMLLVKAYAPDVAWVFQILR